MELKEKVFEMLKSGKSYQEIADELGIYKSKVWRIVHSGNHSVKSGNEDKKKDELIVLLMQKASNFLDKLSRYYAKNINMEVDVEAILLQYCDYIKGMPREVIKILIESDEIFYKHLYKFFKVISNKYLDGNVLELIYVFKIHTNKHNCYREDNYFAYLYDIEVMNKHRNRNSAERNGTNTISNTGENNTKEGD